MNHLSQSLHRTASWVIVNKETNESLFETFDARKVEALNTDKYKAVPILEWLQHLSRTYKSQNEWPSIRIV